MDKPVENATNNPDKDLEKDLKRIDGMYTDLQEYLTALEKEHNIPLNDSPANRLQDLWCEIHQFRDDYPEFNYAKRFYTE